MRLGILAVLGAMLLTAGSAVAAQRLVLIEDFTNTG